MTTYARVADGVVHEIWTEPANFTLGQCFTAAVAAQFVSLMGVSPTPAPGWTATQDPSGIWSFAAPVAAAPTLAQQAAAAIGAGVSLALSGTVTLAATLFPTDPATQAKLGAVVTTVTASGAFPGGASSYPMKDASGAWHSFTSAQYVKVAGAIAAYVAALDLIIDGNPLSATALPPASVAIVV